MRPMFSAEESLEDVVKGLSHIPVGLRQHLSSIVMLHESRLKRAYVIGQSVAMRGRPLLSDYVHIAARLALSEEETSEEWRAAVDSDSCVLDPYAQQGYESVGRVRAESAELGAMLTRIAGSRRDGGRASVRAQEGQLPTGQRRHRYMHVESAGPHQKPAGHERGDGNVGGRVLGVVTGRGLRG